MSEDKGRGNVRYDGKERFGAYAFENAGTCDARFRGRLESGDCQNRYHASKLVAPSELSWRDHGIIEGYEDELSSTMLVDLRRRYPSSPPDQILFFRPIIP